VKISKLFPFLSLILILIACATSTTSNLSSVNYTLHTRPPSSDTNNHIPVYIDKLFSTAEASIISNALKAWNYTLNGYKYYYIADLQFDMDYQILQNVMNTGNGLIILRINSDNEIIDRKSFTNDVIAFVPEIGANYIYIIEDRMTKIQGVPAENINYQNVMMHEIGHTQGAMHITNDKYNLMYPVTTDMVCVDYKTAKQVAEYHGYDLNHMNYCYYSK